MRQSQVQMFYQAHCRIADGNKAFKELVKAGDITRVELQRLIAKRPEVYSRFSGFLATLPE